MKARDELRWRLLWAFLGWGCAAATICGAGVVRAQSVTTTTVADTIQYANGTAAQGTLLISWPGFTAADGTSVQPGSTSVTLGSGGALSVQLAPNAGANPIGTYYTVVYHLNDGTVTREYWAVPASTTAVKLSSVRTSVLPTSVAVQTVSKSYVDTAIARAIANVGGGTGTGSGSTGSYVLKTGDTMSGPLILPGDPTAGLQAADKSYVDASVTGLQTGLGQKVALTPTGNQVVTQPAGTDLRVNRLDGSLYATPFTSLAGSDGVTNAFAASDCANGCEVVAERDYIGTDRFPLGKQATHLSDHRGGQLAESFFSPVGTLSPGQDVAETLTLSSTEAAADLRANLGNGNLNAIGLRVVQNGYRGGNNIFPSNITSTGPYFKSTYSAIDVQSNNYAQGQHVMDTHRTNCYGVGDCLAGSYYVTTSGGNRDNADEGTHPFDWQVSEDTRVFQGTCASGCTAGSQSVSITATANAGTQGDGRFLINTTASKTISTGQLTGGVYNGTPAATATFSGTSFPVSTFFQTSGAVLPQSNNMAPGTVSLGILTSGVLTGFATSTAAAPASSGVACVSDTISGESSQPQMYEMAPYTVTDGTHLQMTFNKPHAAGAVIAMGGLCGYGLEQTVDTVNGIRQVFPVIGSTSATGLYVASGLTTIVGRSITTSAYANVSYTITNIARSNNTVTVTVANNGVLDFSGSTLTVSGVTDSSFNGSFAVTNTAPNQFTYSQTGANASSTGGTIGILTGGYVLYPMAEVLDVYDDATQTVSGKMKLAPNTVAWSQGDTVEQPHYFQERVYDDIHYITQYTPRNLQQQQAGIYYQGNNGPGLRGWVIRNSTPATNYLGNGGTHGVPDFAFQAQGIWNTSMDLQAGETAAFRVHCNSKGCGRWNSGYNLFTLDTTTGGSTSDSINFNPATDTLTFTLGGTPYVFSPSGMTVPTLNVTNLNATNINGGSGGGGGGGSNCSGNVAYSATPVFALQCANTTLHLTLTGNVTSSSFTGLQAGRTVTLIFQVGGSGGYTVAWPSQVHGGFGTSAQTGSPLYMQTGKYFAQQLVVDTDGVTLLNPGAVNQ